MPIDAETRAEFSSVYQRLNQDRAESQKTIKEGFDALAAKIDRHREDTLAELKGNRDQVHRLDLAIRESTTQQALCRAEMGPRVKTLEDTATEKAQKTWDVARPILVKTLEWAIMGGGLYAIYRAAATGGHP